MPTLNLKLYDIDNCLYHKYASNLRQPIEPIETWLIDSNKILWAHEKLLLASESYAKTVIGYGTNRQDFITNRANKLRGGSLTPALPLVQQHLSCFLPQQVVLEPFLMADIYGKNLRAGDSYKAMLREEFSHSKHEKHSQWLFDHSKMSIIYAHAHRVALLNPDMDSIVIDFYDDATEIIDFLTYRYTKHPTLLPHNVVLRLHDYDGQTLTHRQPIQGTGTLDKHYDWTVRYMSSLGYFYSGQEAGVDSNISSHQQLLTYHNDDHYRQPGRKMAMRFGDDERHVPKLLAFREQEIVKMASSPDLVNCNSYTTASDLHHDGLLPDNYAQAAHKKASFSSLIAQSLFGKPSDVVGSDEASVKALGVKPVILG